jgi:hypothetical protein
VNEALQGRTAAAAERETGREEGQHQERHALRLEAEHQRTPGGDHEGPDHGDCQRDAGCPGAEREVEAGLQAIVARSRNGRPRLGREHQESNHDAHGGARRTQRGDAGTNGRTERFGQADHCAQAED